MINGKQVIVHVLLISIGPITSSKPGLRHTVLLENVTLVFGSYLLIKDICSLLSIHREKFVNNA